MNQCYIVLSRNISKFTSNLLFHINFDVSSCMTIRGCLHSKQLGMDIKGI